MFIRIIIIFLVMLSGSIAKEISGIPRIVDGDTVHIDKYKIRLEGIDAPEIRQKCKIEYLKLSFISFNKSYLCGIKSKKKLEKKINYKSISCKVKSKDRYGRYLGTCFKKKINLNKWLVRSGYAVAYLRYSKAYLKDENYAKKKRFGTLERCFFTSRKMEKA